MGDNSVKKDGENEPMETDASSENKENAQKEENQGQVTGAKDDEKSSEAKKDGEAG